MNDDVPALSPSATELWHYAQAITNISTLAARLRGHLSRAREQDGRLAFSEAEHAARHHQARQHPALRLMTSAEQAAWQQRAPDVLTAPPPGQPITVWTARLVDAAGTPTGQWGLQAHTWQSGVVTASLLVVCRDAEDALALTRHLRQNGTPEHLTRLHQLATHTPGHHPAAGPAPAGGPMLGRRAEPLVLSEADWAAALRRELPTALANQIIVTDPAHRHYAAWRELHQLANHEVAHAGADPARLAALVHTVPAWRDDVRNPPALAHWAITQNRGPARNTHTAEPPAAHSHGVQGPSPSQVLTWARGLDPNHPEHRVHAKLEFGNWPAAVDQALARSFPSLVDQTRAAAGSQGRGAPGNDQTTLAELTAQVQHLDPAKPIDRRAAHLMLGRVPPEIDRLLAEKFGDDPRVAEKLHTLYPDGLPAASARHNRGDSDGDEPNAAAAPAHHNNPHDHTTTARDLSPAAPQRRITTPVAGQQPPTTRQAEPHPSARPQRRR